MHAGKEKTDFQRFLGENFSIWKGLAATDGIFSVLSFFAEEKKGQEIHEKKLTQVLPVNDVRLRAGTF